MEDPLETGEAVLLQQMFATVELDKAQLVQHNLLEVETEIVVLQPAAPRGEAGHGRES